MEDDKLLLVLMFFRSLSSSTSTLKEEDAILPICMGRVHAKYVHVIFTLK